MQKLALNFVRIGFICIVLAIVLRLFGFNNVQGLPVIGITPGAFQRLADTSLLFAIAIALIKLMPTDAKESPEESSAKNND